MTDANAQEHRVIEWLTTASKGRHWHIEEARKPPREDDRAGPVFLLNYYAVRYGYDLVLAS